VSRRISLSAFARLGKLKPADRRAILEACWTLGVTRVAVKILPFRRIAAGLAKGLPPAVPLTAEQVREARRVGWAVMAVSRTRLLKTVCLGQAIAAQTMLKRRGIPSTLHLGVAKEPLSPPLIEARTILDKGGLAAHAWVTTGGLFVTGSAGHENFVEVSRIGSGSSDVH